MEPRNVVVTGASHGIGGYIARALAARGMNLLLVARSEGELLRLARELRTGDTTVAVAAVDLADRRAAHRVAEAAATELGAVDVLVNNAATEPQTRFHVLCRRAIPGQRGRDGWESCGHGGDRAGGACDGMGSGDGHGLATRRGGAGATPPAAALPPARRGTTMITKDWVSKKVPILS